MTRRPTFRRLPRGDELETDLLDPTVSIENFTETLTKCQIINVETTQLNQLSEKNYYLIPNNLSWVYNFLLTIASVLLFFLIYLIIRKFSKPEKILRKESYYISYYNILTSLTHAFIISVGCSLVLILDHNVWKAGHAFNLYTEGGKILCTISLGYFIFDFIEYAYRGAFKREIDIFFHHLVCIVALTYTVGSNLYFGYIMIGLMVEVNSIFLHARKIYLWSYKRKDNYHYFFIVWANLVTNIIFRTSPLFYLWYLFVLQWPCLTIIERIAGSVLTTALFITCVILLLRVFRLDYDTLFHRPSDSSDVGGDKENIEHTEKILQERCSKSSSVDQNQGGSGQEKVETV